MSELPACLSQEVRFLRLKLEAAQKREVVATGALRAKFNEYKHIMECPICMDPEQNPEACKVGLSLGAHALELQDFAFEALGLDIDGLEKQEKKQTEFPLTVLHLVQPGQG